MIQRKIKQRIKRILGMSAQAEEPMETSVPQPACVGNIDSFVYKDKVLYVEGWVFDTRCPMEQPVVTFYHGEQKAGEIRCAAVYRKDVAEILHNNQAEASGFFCEAVVQTAADLDVYFEYDTEAGKGNFPVGKIQGTPGWTGTVQIRSLENENCMGNIRYVREHFSQMQQDAGPVKLYSLLQQLEQKKEVYTILAFDHLLGGGASEYLEEKKEEAKKAGYRFITLRQDVKGPTYYISYEYKENRIVYFEREMTRVLEPIGRLDEIWVNELVTYVDPYRMLDQIVELKKTHHAYLKMLLHDFYALCPAVNLMNDRGIYCQVGSEEECNRCIPQNRSNACPECTSGSVWRKNWGAFLAECDEICAFSRDTAGIFRKVYPELEHWSVVPHKPHELPPVKREKKTTHTFNIGILGVLCHKKGLEVVKKLVAYIEERDLDIRIKLIGISDEKIESPVFSCTGRYRLEQLPALTLEHDIDMFLIPSVWPETYSYTTSEVISMDLPVAVFPIGAPAERVKEYDKGLLLSGAEPDRILHEMQTFFAEI